MADEASGAFALMLKRKSRWVEEMWRKQAPANMQYTADEIFEMMRHHSRSRDDMLACSSTPNGIPRFEPPGDCEEGCHICRFQYRSLPVQGIDALAYERSVSDMDAARQLRELVINIHDTQSWLRAKLKTHGDNVLNRWRKWTNPKRKPVLDKALGGLTSKFSHLHTLYAVDHGWMAKRPYRQAFLVPHLNVESMLEEKGRLFSLLFNRSEHDADVYFHMDRLSMEMGLNGGLLEMEFNAKSVVCSGPDYGKLVDWEKAAIHRGQHTSYPVSRCVLEAQCITMHALKTIVEGVLETVPSGSGDTKWRSQCEAGFDIGRGRPGSEVLDRIYGPPPSFDALELSGMAELNRDSLVDEMFDLQSDPPHMQDRIIELKNSKFYDEFTTNDRWQWLSFNVYGWDFFGAMAWHNLTAVTAALSRAIERSAPIAERIAKPEQGPIEPTETDNPAASEGSDSAGDVEQYLVDLEHIVGESWYARTWHLAWSLCRIQAFEKYFQVDKSRNAKPKPQWEQLLIKKEYTTHHGRQMLYFEDALFWALQELTTCDKLLPYLNRGVLLAFVSDLLRDDDNLRRIDNSIVGILSELSTLYEMWWEISLRFPRSERGRPAQDNSLASRKVDGTILAVLLSTIPENWSVEHWPKTGPLLKKVHDTKWPKGNWDTAKVAQATKARHALRDFWDEWRQLWAAKLPAFERDAGSWEQNFELNVGYQLLNLVADPDRVQAEWEKFAADITAGEEEKKREKNARKRKASQSLPTYATPAFSSAHEAGKTTQQPAKKTKVKTRPAEDSIATRVDAAPPPAPEPDPAQDLPSPEKPPIYVTKASLEVFDRMWPNDSGNIKEGKIRWPQVLNAMADTGFSHSQDDGSKAVFTRAGATDGGTVVDGEERGRVRILFHRVHREGDQVDPVVLTRMGRRLTKRLGWKWKRFQERPKAA